MNYALIFAGGTGQRMNTQGKPKQFLELNGKPIIIYTIENFDNHDEIDKIVIVCLKNWIEYLSSLIEKYNINKVIAIVEGGKTGQESIRNGLFYIRDNLTTCPNKDVVLIHDGVRPLINKKLISENIFSVLHYGNAITVTPAIETIVEVNQNNIVETVEDRSRCRLARAPQSFILADILNAHEKSLLDNTNEMIDSAMLMKYYGATLYTVDGPSENIKITTPSDFFVFKAIIDAEENSQIWGL